jgi:hypothetical protein
VRRAASTKSGTSGSQRSAATAPTKKPKDWLTGLYVDEFGVPKPKDWLTGLYVVEFGRAQTKRLVN